MKKSFIGILVFCIILITVTLFGIYFCEKEEQETDVSKELVMYLIFF